MTYLSSLREMLPRLERKEWEATAIASAAVALWFFQRHVKSPRWSAGWIAGELFLYGLIPFALHAVLGLAGGRRRYAAVVLTALLAAAALVRFVVPARDPWMWALILAGVAVSGPLFVMSPPRELGVRGGATRLWMPFIVAGYLVALAGIFALVRTPAFLKSYPYVPLKEGHLGLFAFRELAEGVDMFAWEFFFRGFLLFGLASRVGAVPAILVQAVLFGCAHVGKPELEIYASIIGGLLLGHLCLRVRSMLPAFVAHQMIFLSVEVVAAVVKLRGG